MYDSTNPKIGYNLTLGGDGASHGIYNVASKFSQEDIDNIYIRLSAGQSNISIASDFNVHPDTIGRIN